MKILKFKKIDAFAVGKSSGNPAGAVYLDSPDDLSELEMQKIAKELKGFVNEVGYLSLADSDTFNLKFYSSEREVDLCGHATIAIMYDLIKNNKNLLSKDTIYINTNKGMLSVSNRIINDDAVFISAPQPVFSSTLPQVSSIANALDVDENIISNENPISIINAGLNTLIVPIIGLSHILAINPDLEKLKKFCINQAIDIITVFSRETAIEANAFRTRVFAPTFGYLEDPATGSGNSAFGYYLIKNNIFEGNILSIEQNNSFDNANIVKLEFNKNKNGQDLVSFGGSAIVRINGEYNLV